MNSFHIVYLLFKKHPFRKRRTESNCHSHHKNLNKDTENFITIVPCWHKQKNSNYSSIQLFFFSFRYFIVFYVTGFVFSLFIHLFEFYFILSMFDLNSAITEKKIALGNQILLHWSVTAPAIAQHPYTHVGRDTFLGAENIARDKLFFL